jgi:hypothetical protein
LQIDAFERVLQALPEPKVEAADPGSDTGACVHFFSPADEDGLARPHAFAGPQHPKLFIDLAAPPQAMRSARMDVPGG